MVEAIARTFEYVNTEYNLLLLQICVKVAHDFWNIFWQGKFLLDPG